MNLNYELIWAPIQKKSTENSKNLRSSGIFFDWAGILWSDADFPKVPNPKNSNFDFPLLGDGFRAGKVEWEALGIALYLGNKFKPQEFVAVELGASAAPWMLTLIHHLPSELRKLTVAIEAGRVEGLTSRFWKRNAMKFRSKKGVGKFIFQGLNFRSLFLRGLATNRGGWAWFPRVDISKDNGATGSDSIEHLDRRGVRGISVVRKVNIVKLLKKYDQVHFLHMDIQGAEEQLMTDPSFLSGLQRVDVLLVGTHSKFGDSLALRLPETTCMKLISHAPMKPGGPNGEWPIDGEFLFVRDEILKKLEISGLFLT